MSYTGEWWSTTNAVMWENGEIIDLGRLGGVSAEALAINEHGQTVGWSHIGPSIGPVENHATIWQQGNIIDLNDILDSESSGWTIGRATGINDNGQIVGWGYNPDEGLSDDQVHALLLQPEYDAIVSSQYDYLSDFITLGDTFSFEYYWEMGIEPVEFNFDFLWFNGTGWETLGWSLNFNGTSEDWLSASFYVPSWGRGETTQIRFRVYDWGQETNPMVYLRNIASTSEPVPEPATILLLGTGIAGLAGSRLRRKKK